MLRLAPANTSVVAFGSLARREWTSGSDIDWTLLIDGPSDMEHLNVARDIERILSDSHYKEPGPSGTFGSMSSSHELVHYIGGAEDSNHNLTRRLLLLLESAPLSDEITHNRVTSAILARYILGDPPATTPGRFHLPLFLFNDIVRLWRTMAVDYATKKWQRANRGWALRNLKLRMSRKLLFVKGMLMCFLCDQPFAGTAKDPANVEQEILRRCKEFAQISPVDLLSHALGTFTTVETARKTLNAYDAFLAVLDDEAKRKDLEELPFEQLQDGIFSQTRELTREFRSGINDLFFESHEELTKLTKRYGVF